MTDPIFDSVGDDDDCPLTYNQMMEAQKYVEKLARLIKKMPPYIELLIDRDTIFALPTGRFKEIDDGDRMRDLMPKVEKAFVGIATFEEGRLHPNSETI